MAFRTIGQDIAIQVTLGPFANGQVITFGAATSFKNLAKSVEIDEEMMEAEVSSLGDGIVRNRFRRAKATVRLKIQVSDAGTNFKEKLGYSCKVENKALSTLAAFDTFVGGITKRSLAEEDGENIETVEVTCGIEGWTYSGIYA